MSNKITLTHRTKPHTVTGELVLSIPGLNWQVALGDKVSIYSAEQWIEQQDAPLSGDLSDLFGSFRPGARK